jgi:iron complex transport system substrate-binding protein
LSPRVASLLPASTEWLAELGLGESIVAVSHECDHPASAVKGRPRVTSSRVDPHAAPAEIDRQVRALRDSGEDLYAVDAAALERLRVDVIVTQAQCDVCAVSEESVRALAARLPSRPVVVATSGSTVAGVLDDVLAIGRACGVEERARAVVARFQAGLDALRAAAPKKRPRAVHLEWTDPPMTAASWIPELAEAAGLELFRKDLAGKKSIVVSWDEIRAFEPELVVVAPCGFDIERARNEVPKVVARLPLESAAARVEPADGNALFNRPGPRLLDSARLLHAFAGGAA